MLFALERMKQRYLLERDDSDIAGFHCLLYYAELITKSLVACLVAGVRDDRDRTRYALLYELVRADSIGEWEQALQRLLTGSPSQHLREAFRVFQRDLVERVPPGTWQYESVERLQRVLGILGVSSDPLPNHVAARHWFPLFVQLRNKTRGHGATRGDECARALPELWRTITLLQDNLSVFAVPWVYLHRNLSGKYRVTPLGGDPSPFAYLKKPGQDVSPQDGVYVYCGESVQVELAHSDADASDLFLPNGQFRSSQYELLSYITNERRRVDGSLYLQPAGQLPDSETHGRGSLEPLGEVFSNLPPAPTNYVRRIALETQLQEALVHTRHEIVTLGGPGGTGKTSLALRVLHDLARNAAGRFECMVWFSARDIDLLEAGPKAVRPHGVSTEDFATEFVAYLEPPESSQKGFRPAEYLANALTHSPVGSTLFVFDNFETVTDPPTLYHWLDTHVRPPNKILITTRMREFRGDLSLEVRGMSDEEATELIDLWAKLLGIHQLLTADYVTALMREADGHPYVIKILLGEVAKTGHAAKPERIIASREEILQALFERTYAALSPAAQRLFLLLSSWRSAVPTLCVEAVLLGSADERVDVQAAVDELRRLSFIDETLAPDDQPFISVPLAAAVFGKRKLAAHPYRLAIEADNRFLQNLGPTSKDQIRLGIGPKLERLIRMIASRVGAGELALEGQLPMLEFLAGRLPYTWLTLARLCEEQGSAEWLERAKTYIRRFIESEPEGAAAAGAWERLAALCHQLGDHEGRVHALVSLCEMPGIDAERVSSAANVLNNLLLGAKRDGKPLLSTDAKRYSLERIAAALEKRIDQLDGTGHSRLAWLYLNMADDRRAALATARGLSRDPDNVHLRSLKERGVWADDA